MGTSCDFYVSFAGAFIFLTPPTLVEGDWNR
ncbi:UNVERIFIED_ORG: hypothetical protein GGD58_001454 [Rhizobium pisi]